MPPDILTIDFETRATVDITKVGAPNYAKHPQTDILCLAYKLPGRYVKLWTPARGPLPLELVSYVENGGLIEAHNAGFEEVIWEFVGRPKYHFPGVAPYQWRCSAANAAMHALPRSLDVACKAIGARHQKDKPGYNLMMKMCKPRKLLKAEVIEMAGLSKRAKKAEVDQARGTLEELYGPFWHESPEDLARLALYCGRDVLAEHSLSQALGPMPEDELEIWQLTQEINRVGVYCDLDLARNAIKTMSVLKEGAEAELAELTWGDVTTVNQGARIIKWAGENGYELPNTQKATVVEALDDPDCPDLVKAVLRIKQQFGRSSVTKYQGIIDRADPDDDRVRDHLRYYGAHTGRWSGQGIQTQNFPKPDKGISFDDILGAIDAVKLGDPELFGMLYPNPAAMLSAALRPTICAAPGSTLYCIDYASIEAVLTLWYCGDPGLELFRKGLCLYRDLAGEIYGLDDPQSLDKKSTERQHGKIGVLGSGYGMGPDTMQRQTKIQWGIDLPFGLCKRIIKAYRTKYPHVPRTWKVLQRAFLRCVWNQEDVDIPKGARFEWCAPFVKLYLPSGRPLYFYEPEIRMEIAPWGEEVPVIYYWSENSQNRKWELAKTYGGKILENMIQGMSADLMYDVSRKVRKDPSLGRLVMSVHDELGYEIHLSMGPERACQRTCEIMKTPPEWAGDCPIDVEAWIGRRYRK
jgi:DNA polymerase